MLVGAAEVEQARLLRMRGLGIGPFERQAHAGQRAGAVGMQQIEAASLDQRVDHALVHARAVDPLGEVEQAGERPRRVALLGAPLAGRDDGLHRALPGALDGAQPVVDQLVACLARRRLEAVHADVDVGRRERDAELLGVGEQHLQLLAVAHFDGHVGGVELRRAMRLQPGRVVRQQRVGGGVRLVEAVARELLHQVEDLVGLGGPDLVGGGTLAEDLAVLGHLLGLLLAHRAAQHVGAAQRVAAQHLGGLHHLLLVDHDAVGLGQHRLHQRMRVLHGLLAVLARDEGGDQVHRARTIQGHQRDQVAETAGLGVA